MFVFRNFLLKSFKGQPVIFFSTANSGITPTSSLSHHSSLNAISPLDGRYNKNVQGLKDYFSEASLNKYRVRVEVEWLKFLISKGMVKMKDGTNFKASPLDSAYLDFIHEQYEAHDAASRIKEIENQTNHDVKAVEYYIKEKLDQNKLFHDVKEYVHFCCTSEDINNLAYSLLLTEAKMNSLQKTLEEVIRKLSSLSETYQSLSMLSRTHGQVASPTTVGKEFANFAYRINKQYQHIARVKFTAKLNGAVGNFNAHMFAYPEYDWPKLSREFIEALGLEFNPYTTQIEPHDTLAVFYSYLQILNTILIGLSRDIWHYISIGYFTQKSKKNEVGSSTMPHKINPIDFENSEGNLGLANSIIQHFITKLPISRLQRDLSDSTVMRNHGLALGYSILAYKSLLKGLEKLEADSKMIEDDLNNHWEVLAEPIQTLMRKYGYDNPYERLKEMTRGQKVTKELLSNFIKTLDLPAKEKERLLKLTPASYIGNAQELALLKK